MHINYRYPFQFDVRGIADCSYAVLGFGQWLLSSRTVDNPYTAAFIESEMRAMLTRVKLANPRTQVFVRSMNYNGLGSGVTRCPTTEYRTPSHVAMLNDV